MLVFSSRGCVRIGVFTMKWVFGLVLAGVFSVSALPAIAADKPVKAVPFAPAPAVNWTGIYVGGQVGASKMSTHIFNDSGNFSGEGIIGGATLGANWQIPNSQFVLGVEGDWSWGNAQGTVGAPFCGPNCNSQFHSLATIRGRVGYAFKRELFYLTGGAAFVKFGLGQPAYYNDSMTSTGWTIGGGVESMIDAHWSWKFEYLYADFEQDKTIAQLTVAPACPSPPGFACSDYARVHVLRGGVNYRF